MYCIETSKQAREVAEAFSKIYSRRLDYSKTLMFDPGKEFMGPVGNLMKEKRLKIQWGEAGNHRTNRTLAEKLIFIQYTQEMISDGRSREWVDGYPGVLKAMNSETILFSQ